MTHLKSESTKLETKNNETSPSVPAFRLEAETPEHSNFLEEVLVGMLLGDAWLEKQKVNARFRFEQSHIRTEFFF